jgi:hypothetical protein
MALAEITAEPRHIDSESEEILLRISSDKDDMLVLMRAGDMVMHSCLISPDSAVA